MARILPLHQHPMRAAPTQHPVLGDQHDRQRGRRAPRRRGPPRRADRPAVDAEPGGFAPVIVLDDLHRPALVRIAHRRQEQMPARRQTHLGVNAAMGGGDRHAEGAAAAVPGGQIDRRRLPPQAQLQPLVQRLDRAEVLQRHHQAGGAAGEIGRLREIGHGRRRRRLVVQQLFHADERPCRPHSNSRPARGAGSRRVRRARDRRSIVLAHLQPQQDALAVEGIGLGGGQQPARQAGPARRRIDGKRIEPRHRRSRAKQQQRIAKHRAPRLGDKTGGVRTFQEPAKAASRNAVAGKARVFKAQQVGKIGHLGQAYFNVR
jgi:hypothetical protein